MYLQTLITSNRIKCGSLSLPILKNIFTWNLLALGWQKVNGSPSKSSWHTQFGVWLITKHWAFCPQIPGQGSLHFWLIHANLSAHSLLLIHSGLQYGGDPTYSGKQEHDGKPLRTLQTAFDPHGDGWQGSTKTGSSSKILRRYCIYYLTL